ncbi:MAG: hypothetical protein M0P73_15120 [Syntrophobacterales bacterium]|jgi:hypothetical protein|nr:hypothetical protein [Syntrophobacterales bacterium]
MSCWPASAGRALYPRPRCRGRLETADLIKALAAIILIAALLTPAAADPKVPLPPPLPPGVAPVWTPVPPSPAVLYAPNIPGNVFRLHKKYYYYYGGYWYRGKRLLGPWKPVRKVPRALILVPRDYFK